MELSRKLAIVKSESNYVFRDVQRLCNIIIDIESEHSSLELKSIDDEFIFSLLS